MDIITYALCKKIISDSLQNVGNVFTVKGKVDEVEQLNGLGGVSSGDVYLVGPNSTGGYDEYYYSDEISGWDFMGSVNNEDGGISDTQLYAGTTKTGTIENPAEGTILYTLKQNDVNSYVAKEDGKALSSNDFTNEDKEKLDAIYSKQEIDDLLVDTLNEVSDQMSDFANDYVEKDKVADSIPLEII